MMDQIVGQHSGPEFQWSGDQILTSAMILNKGWCTLPKSHGAWWHSDTYINITKRSEQPAVLEDRLPRTCIQDDDGESRLRSPQHLKQSCYWLHFWPHTKTKAKEKAYMAIAEKYHNPIPSNDIIVGGYD